MRSICTRDPKQVFVLLNSWYNLLMMALYTTFIIVVPPAFVSRTYIGGGMTTNSSLAMKIQRKSQNNNNSSKLSLPPSSGSLSSLHETALTSDFEDVRSSVSAYQPISRSSKR